MLKRCGMKSECPSKFKYILVADDVGNNDLFVTMPSYQLINTIEKMGQTH